MRTAVEIVMTALIGAIWSVTHLPCSTYASVFIGISTWMDYIKAEQPWNADPKAVKMSTVRNDT